MTADPVSSLKGSFPGYPGRVSTKDWEEEAAPTLAKTTIMPRRPKHAPTMHILGPKLFLPVIPMSASSSPTPPASVALHQSSPNSTKTNPPQDSQYGPFSVGSKEQLSCPWSIRYQRASSDKTYMYCSKSLYSYRRGRERLGDATSLNWGATWYYWAEVKVRWSVLQWSGPQLTFKTMEWRGSSLSVSSNQSTDH